MRSGILGVRKRVALLGGVGFKGIGRRKKRRFGMKKRKTVCGHKINEKINQINLKVVKEGSKKLAELLGVAPAEGAKEEKPAAVPKAEAKKEEPKKEEKSAEAPKKEEKPKEQPKEEKKE
ncbi:MAG: S6e family ribosomal protein [Nanoarchaeota archaeon]